MGRWKIIFYMPAYDAATTLPEFLERFREVEKELVSIDADIEALIIVNDGSTDKTSEIITKSMNTLPYLKCLDKKKNGGATDAVLDGMKEALRLSQDQKNTILVRLDSDLEHQPEDIVMMLTPIVSNGAKLTVGYIPFDYRSGFFVKLFNDYVGLNESRKFLGVDVPQFCPGFNAINAGLFRKIFPLLFEKAKRFRKNYGIDMLTLDFVMLVLAKQLGQKPIVVKLSPIEDKWLKKIPISKLFSYIDYHIKNVTFLGGEQEL